jgi:hypothetical protein
MPVNEIHRLCSYKFVGFTMRVSAREDISHADVADDLRGFGDATAVSKARSLGCV